MNRYGRALIGCVLSSLALSLSAPSAAADDGPQGAPRPGQVQVQKVEVRFSLLGPVVLLGVRKRAIPVFVDPTVAGSIQGALSGEKSPRPLSHDLMRTILAAFDGKVSQVVITLKDGIYYGGLTVVVRDTAKVFDSRSSDAIALAIHFKAPILVSEELLDSVGVDLEEPGGVSL